MSEESVEVKIRELLAPILGEWIAQAPLSRWPAGDNLVAAILNVNSEEIDAMKEKLRLAEEALEVMKGEHILLCKYHRCSKHVEVSQLNTKEFSGAECGACVLEDAKKKDENGIPMHLRMDMENTGKMLARQMARIDKLTQETFGYKKNISDLESKLKLADERLRIAEEVLEFYANDKNYDKETGAVGIYHPGSTAGGNIIDADFEVDCGVKASEALLKLQGKVGK